MRVTEKNFSKTKINCPYKPRIMYVFSYYYSYQGRLGIEERNEIIIPPFRDNQWTDCAAFLSVLTGAIHGRLRLNRNRSLAFFILIL